MSAAAPPPAGPELLKAVWKGEWGWRARITKRRIHAKGTPSKAATREQAPLAILCWLPDRCSGTAGRWLSTALDNLQSEMSRIARRHIS